jgi:hypothetical protein
VIATKFVFDIDPNTGQQRGLDSRLAHIKQVAEASLSLPDIQALPEGNSKSALYGCKAIRGKKKEVERRRLVPICTRSCEASRRIAGTPFQARPSLAREVGRLVLTIKHACR